MKASSVDAIETPRLSLRWFSPGFSEASLAGKRDLAAQWLEARLPAGWPDAGAERRLRSRLDQMTEDPASGAWLLRAMVRREDGVMVGYINFHGPPDERGRVELGYTVFERHRRLGYASEAIRGMMEWARTQAPVAAFRLSISPENLPSLGLARALGFECAGSRMDDVDGLEWVFELVAPSA